MQKMNSITPSIYKTIHQKVFFQKFWSKILTIMKVLAKTTRGPVYLQLFRPSVIRDPCLDKQLCWLYFPDGNHQSVELLQIWGQ